MRITVFGASGKVGQLVVHEALRRNYDVVAVVHTNNPFDKTAKLTVIKADIYDAQAVTKAITGSNAVISCLGSWGTKKRNVLTAAMQAIIPAMTTQHIKRIVTLTGTGALAPGEADTFGHKLVMALSKPFPAGKVFADGEQHMRLLANSTLDWTTLRSPIMKNGDDTRYKLDLKPGSAIVKVARQAVATALLDILESNNSVRQAPILH